MWMELKKELYIQYSWSFHLILITQAITHLEQGPDELLDDYLHCARELLSKICHISNMSRISVEGTSHYAVVYGLKCRKQKDSIVGHWSILWRTMEECFMDIHNISTVYEWAKGYCRAKFNTLDASCITEIKTMENTGPCYKCGGTHLQCDCTNNRSNKFQAKMPTQQTHKGNNYTDRFHNNKKNSNLFPVGTLSFQASEPIRSGKDMLLSIDTIKFFFSKIGERYSIKRKLGSQVKNNISTESSVNEVMETITAVECTIYPRSTWQSIRNYFDQFCGLMSPCQID